MLSIFSIIPKIIPILFLFLTPKTIDNIGNINCVNKRKKNITEAIENAILSYGKDKTVLII